MPAPVHVVKGKSGTHLVPHVPRDDGPHPALGTAAMAAIVAAALIVGVVLSPDEPQPAEDWNAVIVFEVNRQLEDHLASDHAADHTHEVTPSASPSASPPSPTATTSPASRRTTPTASPRPAGRSSTATPRPSPRRSPTPTARPVPTASPCFRPGKPNSGHDPCSWPPDG